MFCVHLFYVCHSDGRRLPGANAVSVFLLVFLRVVRSGGGSFSNLFGNETRVITIAACSVQRTDSVFDNDLYNDALSL
jgi:hypothetical protein